MKAVTQFKDWLQFIVGTGKKTNGTILANIEVRKVLRSSASPRSEKKRRAKTEVFGLDLADTTTSSDDGVKVLFDLHFVSNKQKKEVKRWDRLRQKADECLRSNRNASSSANSTVPPESPRAGKPILVLDLDQTLIDSTPQPRLPASLETTDSIRKGFVIYSSVHIVIVEGTTYYVKFRPYLIPFLRAIHEYFELHLYTHSRRVMAEAILELLGEDRKLFSQVVAREDVQSTKRKTVSHLRLDPDQRASAVIVDDNYRNVWGIENDSVDSSGENRRERIIQIPPFVYFNRLPSDPDKKRKTRDEQYYLGEGECAGVQDEALSVVYDQLLSHARLSSSACI